jgi:ribosomal peptide maturation radical SAM protein 1
MQTVHEKSGPHISKRIILAAAPWPLFNRPSIQLGALKSYLTRHLPQVSVTTAHFYLKIAEVIGYDLYRAISERTWLAESLYAAMLYPERTPVLEKLFLKYASGKPALKNVQFQDLADTIQQVSDDMLNATDWESFGLAGFSMSLCQLTSTLYFLRVVKKQFPDIRTVVGGATFSSSSALDYLRLFPDIDYIVIGEGERPLSFLVQRLMNHDGDRKAARLPEGLAHRSLPENRHCSFWQLDDLKKLPPPDYDDYLQTLNTFSPEKRFFPTLPVELSRGCWWKQPSTRSGFDGCAFCNLNLQWKGYRKKGNRQLIKEIDYLTSRHQVLSVAFMDNVLPPVNTGGLFAGLGHLGKDFKFFSEIRAATSLNTLREMRSAGMADVQVGIEALSSRLLQKMNKGVNAIQNLEIIKNCEATGIKNDANLILHFPGSDETDVAETLSAMDYAMVFRPLQPVHFWLGLESPVWRKYKAFQIKSVHNHPHYRILFPEKISNSCRFIIQAYRGDLTLQKKLWKPVMQKIQRWEKRYAALQKHPFDGPIMGYRDGKSFLMIHHRQYRSETIQHRLEGSSRKIYLFCQNASTSKQILTAFPEITEDRLMPFLHMMKAKHLMFEEKGKYLSLAVPLR